MEKFNDLICYLIAIENNAKDIHYNCSGDNFYGNHLFADRIGDGISDFVDQIKENCILAHGYKVKHSSEYLKKASELIPNGSDFKSVKDLILDTLVLIEDIHGTSRGDSKLLDDIGDKLQNNLGLINVMFGEIK